MFFRLHTDGTRTPIPLQNQFAGPQRTACWIIGGGPSLVSLPVEAIIRSPVPRFAMNLAGTHLLRPHFWTAYDPTVRFHRSVFLDASIAKFVHPRRAMDLVPGTNFKVCECPNLVFFERAARRGFHAFPGPETEGVTDWQDSFIQAIDLAYRLGFRRLYLAGCDLHVRPSASHIKAAVAVGVEYRRHEPLKEFYDRCGKAGGVVPVDGLDADGQSDALPGQYHFDERKPLAAAVNTDLHYFRVVQWLRLSRRSLGLAGLELVSVTPDSRLNAFFPHCPVEQAIAEIESEIGCPQTETTRGKYTETSVHDADAPPMRDYRPLNWNEPVSLAVQNPPAPKCLKRPPLRELLNEIPEVAVDLREEG